NLRPQRLDEAGDSRDQSAASDRHEDRRELARTVTQDLVADGPLSGDHEWIVERIDEHRSSRLDELVAVSLRLRVTVAPQDNFRAEILDRLHLDLRRRLRHDDQRAKPQMAGRVSNTLRVVAGARRDHTSRAFGSGELGDAIVGAAQLVAEDRLQIFAL